MKTYDVVSICNALVDILIRVEESDITHLGLNKGVMTLVDHSLQNKILAHFSNHHLTVELGGSAMNAVRTLAELGKKTAFGGMVSDDLYGQKILHRMEQLGIGAHLGRSQEPTGTCLILITPDGERTMLTNLGASRLYSIDQVPEAQIKRAKVFHFCGYQWDTEGQKSAITTAIKVAREHGTVVSFDVADPFVVGRNRETFISLIEESADIVFTNREEAKMLYGKTPEYAAERIAASGAIAVVKLGADGALIKHGASESTTHHHQALINAYAPGEFRIAPVATEVMDTTAAGDMFAAGFLYGFTSQRPLAVCGHMAATIASDVISRIGATVSNVALGAIASF